jgi:uncharacterized protein (DUF2336 family)
MTIVTMRARLTDADVRMLVKGVSEEERGQAAHKICRCIEQADLTIEERQHAEDILRFMAKDATIIVRRALAVAMKNSLKLPRDVANKLARDMESIALPILEHSPVLSDSDLIEILRAAGPNRQIAIAGRQSLSAMITGEIAESGVPAALERALANDGALFDEEGLERSLERMADRPAIIDAMVERRKLPTTIVEKLLAHATGAAFDHLVNHHALPPQLAIELASGARERATIDLIDQAALQSDIGRFVEQINLQGRLTPSLMMRAICRGHIDFVEHALAELAGVPHARMWLLVHDAGPLGLKNAFERAGLPQRLFPPFRAAIDVYHQIQRERDHLSDRDRFRALMMERVLTLFQSVPRDDLDYLLEKLDGISVRPARAAV